MLIDSLQKLPTPEEMRQWDRATIEFGIPETMLMENAAKAALNVCKQKFGSPGSKWVCLFMGGGNNGGDAAALARHIIDSQGHALLLSLKRKEEIKNAPLWHLDLAIKDGANFHQIIPEALKISDLLSLILENCGQIPYLFIDGILGTGFKGPLKDEIKNLINSINELGREFRIPVLALDLPSGLDALTGMPLPVAIRATCTVAFAAPKPGMVLPGAQKYLGELVCRPIGLPHAIRDSCISTWRLLDGRGLANLRQPLPSDSYKNIWGHVTVIGGAKGYAGAARLACMAALRAGCGLVDCVAPKSNMAFIKGDTPEIMSCPAGRDDSWPAKLDGDIAARLAHSDALVIGPGFGLDASAENFLHQILNLPDRRPCVLDADALKLIGTDVATLRSINPLDVLTPHPGEAGALLGLNAKKIQLDRFGALEKLCEIQKGAVVLKGAGTLVGQGQTLRGISPYDIPHLAIGGAGDALAGCIGGLMARAFDHQRDAFSNAILGVMLHSIAGIMLACKFPERGATCSDLIQLLPHVHEFLASYPETIEGMTPWPNFSLNR